MGNAHPNLAPYQPFATQDGAIVVAVGNQGQFQALCRALGRPELADDARFLTNAARVQNRALLAPALAPAFAAAPTDAWIAALEAAGVPCGPINTVDRVFSDPQAIARGLVVEQGRPDLEGSIRTVASPIRLSRTPAAYPVAPPALGQDSFAVLRDQLGLSAEQLEALARDGIIAQADGSTPAKPPL